MITLGNHSFGKRDIMTMLSDSQCIIRPANYPACVPGSGYSILNIDGWRILSINVLGTALMDSMACPFATVDKILAREEGSYDVSVLDIHAESTSEKIHGCWPRGPSSRRRTGTDRSNTTRPPHLVQGNHNGQIHHTVPRRECPSIPRVSVRRHRPA